MDENRQSHLVKENKCCPTVLCLYLETQAQSDGQGELQEMRRGEIGLRTTLHAQTETFKGIIIRALKEERRQGRRCEG